MAARTHRVRGALLRCLAPGCLRCGRGTLRRMLRRPQVPCPRRGLGSEAHRRNAHGLQARLKQLRIGWKVQQRVRESATQPGKGSERASDHEHPHQRKHGYRETSACAMPTTTAPATAALRTDRSAERTTGPATPARAAVARIGCETAVPSGRPVATCTCCAASRAQYDGRTAQCSAVRYDVPLESLQRVGGAAECVLHVSRDVGDDLEALAHRALLRLVGGAAAGRIDTDHSALVLAQAVPREAGQEQGEKQGNAVARPDEIHAELHRAHAPVMRPTCNHHRLARLAHGPGGT